MFVLIWTTDVGQAIWNFEAKGQVPKHPKPPLCTCLFITED